MQAHYVGMPGIPNGPEPEKRIRCTMRAPDAWRNWRDSCMPMGRTIDGIYRPVPDARTEQAVDDFQLYAACQRIRRGAACCTREEFTILVHAAMREQEKFER